jgi:septum formation protein
LVPQAEGQLNDNKPLKHKLILASKSARRAEILQAVGWPFEAIASNVDETRAPSEDAVCYVERLAREKAQTVAAGVSGGLVLGGDTVVVIDDEILGQPRDDEDARRMLRLLSGKWHEVVTGVALVPAGQLAHTQVDHEITRVRFAEMSDAEMEWYLATGEPMDKAGAYGIQGRAGLFIEEIEGDYFNIVGLPVRLVYEMVQRIDL